MGERPEDPLPPAADALAGGREVNWDDPSLDEASRSLRLVEQLARAYARPVPPEPEEVGPPPKRIGRFPVEGVLGRGGMGVVYRARDPRLDRLVAIKTLPDPLSRSAAAREQLTREARLLAAAHHPNLTVIHGLEVDENGCAFLVLELVPGESLADRLRRAGALPVEEALGVGSAIAEALVAAHEAGVLHGDLKPANVMIEPNGRVRVLDFGLARRIGAAADAGASGTSPVIGTAGYIAPERLTGQDDVRSDLFSFGCILYECLAGEPAFPGASSEEVLAAVLSSAPDLGRLPDHSPPAARELLASCLARDPAVRPEGARAVLTALEQARGRRAEVGIAGNLPLAGTSFVGRAQAVADCEKRIAGSRLTTLTGVGGCGKTRLAVEVARRMRARFPDGVWLVDLTRAARPSEVAEVAAAALGGVSPVGEERVERAVEKRLERARALVLLDNAEHVRDRTAALAAGILERCPDVSLLVTSREPLAIPGEQVIAVPVLEIPPPGTERDIEALARAEAVALFLDRARQVSPGFALDGARAAAVGAIVRAVEGLPLAIELAAARLRILSPEEIAARMDRPLALLRGNPASTARRHATMRAALAWSADLLPHEESQTFRRLSVCAGGWDLEAACSVGAIDDEFEIVDRMSRLADKSLVEVIPCTGRPTRYRMLEPVRDLARERLAEAGEEEAARARHAAHFLAFAERGEQEITGGRSVAWYERLEDELGNFQEAFEWYLGTDGGAEGALRLSGALWLFCHMRGHRVLGCNIAERAIARAGADAPPWARARALFAHGALLPFVDSYVPVGAKDFEEAARLFHLAGDRTGEARALNGHAMCLSSQLESERAIPIFERAAAIYRETGDKRGLGTVLHNMARDAWLRGDLETAVRGFAETVEIARPRSDPAGVYLGMIQARLRRFGEARATLEACPSYLRRVGVRNDHGSALLLAVAELLEGEGSDEAAARMFGAVDALHAAIDLEYSEADAVWKGRDAVVARLESRLGADRYRATYDAGRALTPEQALDEVERLLR